MLKYVIFFGVKVAEKFLVGVPFSVEPRTPLPKKGTQKSFLNANENRHAYCATRVLALSPLFFTLGEVKKTVKKTCFVIEQKLRPLAEIAASHISGTSCFMNCDNCA